MLLQLEDNLTLTCDVKFDHNFSNFELLLSHHCTKVRLPQHLSEVFKWKFMNEPSDTNMTVTCVRFINAKLRLHDYMSD